MRSNTTLLMASMPSSRKVFIVHGKDEKNKDALKEMLQKWALEPVVLAEQPSRGRTLIENLVKHTSDVGFAFVLMTPDDIGATQADLEKILERIKGLTGKYTDAVEQYLFIAGDIGKLIDYVRGTLKPRARQNVLFEYGLCIGTLKRENVCLLVSGEVELPTDILGWGYIKFDASVDECEQEIKRELRAAGYLLGLREAGFVPVGRIDYCNRCGSKEVLYPQQNGRFLCSKCIGKEPDERL